jgi:uncharacterized protein
MPRAVLDSSVLISAFLTPKGIPGQLLDAAESGAFVLCLSDAILLETASVLLREHKLQQRYAFDPARAESFCDGLAAIALMATGLPDLPDAVPLDPKDNPIVATAVAAGAEYLVTGDRRHLLKLERYAGIAIITPRRFLEILG